MIQITLNSKKFTYACTKRKKRIAKFSKCILKWYKLFQYGLVESLRTLFSNRNFPLPDEPVGLSEALRPLYLYWAAARQDKLMPSRADIDPITIPRQLLPNITLMDVISSPIRFRYRLMGTAVTEMLGFDWTGRYVDELPGAGEIVHRQCADTVTLGKPAVHFSDSKKYDPSLMQHKSLRYERLLLPLSDGGQSIAMMLGGTVIKNFHL